MSKKYPYLRQPADLERILEEILQCAMWAQPGEEGTNRRNVWCAIGAIRAKAESALGIYLNTKEECERWMADRAVEA